MHTCMDLGGSSVVTSSHVSDSFPVPCHIDSMHELHTFRRLDDHLNLEVDEVFSGILKMLYPVNTRLFMYPSCFAFELFLLRV